MDQKNSLKRKRETISDRFCQTYKRVATESFEQRLGHKVSKWMEKQIKTTCREMEDCDIDEYFVETPGIVNIKQMQTELIEMINDILPDDAHPDWLHPILAQRT